MSDDFVPHPTCDSRGSCTRVRSCLGRFRTLEQCAPVLPPLPVGQPIAWIRCHPDGRLTDEVLLESRIEPVRRRSGAWLPLGLITLPNPTEST